MDRLRNWKLRRRQCTRTSKLLYVSGGLVGITINASARTKFFLIALEISKTSNGGKIHGRPHHRCSGTLPWPFSCCYNKRGQSHLSANPDNQGIYQPLFSWRWLYNLVTKKVVCETANKDLGKKLFSSFVKDRLKSGTTNFWDVMKKRKIQTWKSSGKVIKVKAVECVVELKEDQSLFAHPMMVWKGRQDADIKDAISLYEFTVVPRSRFAADGTMLHCSCKSTLMHILDRTGAETSTSTSGSTAVVKVAVVDGRSAVLREASVGQYLQRLSRTFYHSYFQQIQWHAADSFDIWWVRRFVFTEVYYATQAIRDPRSHFLPYRGFDSYL